MKTGNPEDVALRFVECINNQDLKGLVALMTEDHVFIDYGGRVMGKKVMVEEGWPGYFSQYPEYRIHISKITRSGNDIALIGTTTGSHAPPGIEARWTLIWIARIRDGLVAEWRIYSDIDHIRERIP